MNTLNDIKNALSESLDTTFNLAIRQVADNYAYLIIADHDQNEIEIINDQNTLRLRISGFESSDLTKIINLKRIIEVFQHYTRKYAFDNYEKDLQ